MAFDAAPASAISGSWNGQQGKDVAAVFLCTCQGLEFLRAQLDAIAAQSCVAWPVGTSDDRSTGSPLDLPRPFQSLLGARCVFTDQQRGLTTSFHSAVYSPNISSASCAYAGRDHVWNAEKSAGAAAWLGSVPADLLPQYCSRTRLIQAPGLAKTLLRGLEGDAPITISVRDHMSLADI